MEQIISISYYWKCNDNKTGKVKKTHLETLKEKALERILKMAIDGYVSGELHCDIRLNSADGPDGVSYCGWWSITQ